ncbi:SDR family NAD(P)-dependent oxidoreductase [Amycolatopsis pithecellobii]|uniref:SDR family oxidoreductase n=1 Tax=Amycolatopsis pithecellobii TaxID=664692 RepID=A0A6N7YWX8_9PSEU|nr:SDR family oxidoreductase [Amycolatopsis pithecellobii]MTD57575.1 SDR family oxidoreductase [Amycolatopsis pithecellobii]
MSAGNAKVFIVTGGLGGIGGEAARLLAESGAHVVVTDVVETGGAAFAAELSADGPEAFFVQADLTEEDEVRALVESTVERFGRLDGAFNNAGVTQHEKPLVELTTDDFIRVMRLNVVGTFHCLKHEMRAMTGGGSIVNTSSALGVMALPNRADYIASKHAVCGLTRAAAVEGAPLGIRVNAILPGSIRTAMAEAVFGSTESAAYLERAAGLHLLGRPGEPVEIGHAARWLLSDEASFITGALIPVEGGLTAGRQP